MHCGSYYWIEVSVYTLASCSALHSISDSVVLSTAYLNFAFQAREFPIVYEVHLYDYPFDSQTLIILLREIIELPCHVSYEGNGKRLHGNIGLGEELGFEISDLQKHGYLNFSVKRRLHTLDLHPHLEVHYFV